MGIGHGADIVRNGLVLHLDAANKKSYPGTGTAWNDLSSNNNFTLNNSPTLSNGYFNFDGINETATSVSTFPMQISNTDFTIRLVFFTN